jgi:hypothetical protein
VGWLERRVGAIENHLVGVNTRIDALADEMLQRFRVVNGRLAGAA